MRSILDKFISSKYFNRTFNFDNILKKYFKPNVHKTVQGKSFWYMIYYQKQGDKCRPVEEIIKNVKHYSLGNSFMSCYDDYDDNNMYDLETFARTDGPLIIVIGKMAKGNYVLQGERLKNFNRIKSIRKNKFFSNCLSEWDNAFHFYWGGYPEKPKSRKHIYKQWKFYYEKIFKDIKRYMMSINGFSFYQHYAGRWGTDIIGLEIGTSIASSQTHIAFCRGASKQYNLPWLIDISPWAYTSILSYDDTGPWVSCEGGGTWGPNEGRSINLLERHWYVSYFSGTNILCPEASGWNFFDGYLSNGWLKLSPLGRAGKQFFKFTQDNPERGIPYIPFAIILDQFNGFHGFEKPWRYYELTDGDRQAIALFSSFFPNTFEWGNDKMIEKSLLVNGPYGDTVDVLLSDASFEVISSYPVLILAADFEKNLGFENRLISAVEKGIILTISDFQLNSFKKIKEIFRDNFSAETICRNITECPFGKGNIILIENKNPSFLLPHLPYRIPEILLSYLSEFFMPFKIKGSIQYIINYKQDGWIILLVNNNGVWKIDERGPVIFDVNQTSKVDIEFKDKRPLKVIDMITQNELKLKERYNDAFVSFKINPGGIKILDITMGNYLREEM